MQSYKKILIKSSVLLISVLLLLTLFSNTIYTFNLPGVALDYTYDGVIRNEAKGEGVVEFVQSESFYTGENGKIELFVQTGDEVSIGSPLYSIEADTDDLRKSLDSALQEIDRISLSISKTQSDIDYTQGLLTSLETTETVDNQSVNAEILGYEQEIERLSIELEQKNKSLSIEFEQKSDELKKVEILFNAGAIPRADLIEIQNAVEGMNNQIDQLNKGINNQISQLNEKKQKAAERQAENTDNAKISAEKDYTAKSRELNKSLSDLDFQLQGFVLQKRTQEETINNLKKQIENGGKQTIYADNNGVITKIGVDLEQSNFVGKNTLILKLGLLDSAFQTTAIFRENVDFLNVDDNVTVNIKTRRQYNLTGTVMQVFYEDGALKAKIQFIAAGNTSGGETAEVHIEKISEVYRNILPNAAIRKDAGGYYILYVEEVKGSFGYEYYAKRMTINVLRQDVSNTAFNIITEEKLPIIVGSDKPVSENERIRIVSGSDLVEIR